jgi:hypothetical protein
MRDRLTTLTGTAITLAIELTWVMRRGGYDSASSGMRSAPWTTPT